MIEEIKKLLDEYVSWLKDNTALREVNGWVEITTPYLDRHNDYVQIYAKRANGGFVLSDDGHVIEDLQQSGCTLDRGKRKELLNVTLQGFGVRLEEEALVIHASSSDFPLRKHNLLQAILAVNDLFYLAETDVVNLFIEDLTAWLDSKEIRYIPRVKFAGKSGYDQVFDFVIPKSVVKPERILKAINKPDRSAAQALLMAWIDTKETRPRGSKAYAFLNDDRSVPPGVIDALRRYDVTPLLWSKREEAREELAA